MATNIIKQMAKKPQTVALIIAVVVVAFILVFSTSGSAAKFYSAKTAKIDKTSEAKPISTPPSQPVIRTVQNAPPKTLAVRGCTETDTGIDWYLYGIVYGESTTASDYCKTDDKNNTINTLIERFCDASSENLIGETEFDCTTVSKICKDGACV